MSGINNTEILYRVFQIQNQIIKQLKSNAKSIRYFNTPEDGRMKLGTFDFFFSRRYGPTLQCRMNTLSQPSLFKTSSFPSPLHYCHIKVKSQVSYITVLLLTLKQYCLSQNKMPFLGKRCEILFDMTYTFIGHATVDNLPTLGTRCLHLVVFSIF